MIQAGLGTRNEVPESVVSAVLFNWEIATSFTRYSSCEEYIEPGGLKPLTLIEPETTTAKRNQPEDSTPNPKPLTRNPKF